MSSEWKNALRQILRSNEDRRIIVMGIGHELSGDDAVGLLIVRALKPLMGNSSRLLLIDAGNAPENYTGAIRTFKPDLVLLIDAAFMDAAPGTIHWLLPAQMTGIGSSGHHLPLSVLAEYLTSELRCQTVLIGIQPASTALDSPQSSEVLAASAAIMDALEQMLTIIP